MEPTEAATTTEASATPDASATRDATPTATATPEAILEVEEEMTILGQKIRAKAREVALKIDPALPPFGLKLLRLLARLGPTHASAAADLLETDRSIISRQVKQLEELGLVELRVDANDGRARFIVVTPVALERMTSAVGPGETLMHGALEGWPEADLHQFADYLKRLNTSGL